MMDEDFFELEASYLINNHETGMRLVAGTHTKRKQKENKRKRARAYANSHFRKLHAERMIENDSKNTNTQGLQTIKDNFRVSRKQAAFSRKN